MKLDEAMRRAVKAGSDDAWWYEDAFERSLASLAADGYPLMPREATNEMYRAGLEAPQTVNGIYKAMIVARPKPGGYGVADYSKEAGEMVKREETDY